MQFHCGIWVLCNKDIYVFRVGTLQVYCQEKKKEIYEDKHKILMRWYLRCFFLWRELVAKLLPASDGVFSCRNTSSRSRQSSSDYINAASRQVRRPTLSKFFNGWILNTMGKSSHLVWSCQLSGSFIFIPFTFLLSTIAIQRKKMREDEGEKERERSNGCPWLVQFGHIQRVLLVNLAYKVLSL